MTVLPVSRDGSRGVASVIVGGCFTVIATVAVALRIVSRRMMRNPLGADDYMIVVALIFGYGCSACNIISVIYGGTGIHIEHLQKSQITFFYKNLIPTIILWATACTSVKVSLLFLYIRTFAVRPLRMLAYTAMAIVIGWWLSVLLEEFLLCRPFAYNWNQEIKDGSCGDGLAAYIAAGVINLCTDFLVLCLPVPVLLGLHLPLRNRVVLLGVFGVGFCVCIISCTRIAAVASWRITDPAYTIWPVILWSQLEFSLGIICACVPLMRPIFGKVFALESTRRTGRSYRKMQGNKHAPEGNQLSDDQRVPLGPVGTLTSVHAGKSSNMAMGDNYQHDMEGECDGAIQIERTWDVQYTSDRTPSDI